MSDPRTGPDVSDHRSAMLAAIRDALHDVPADEPATWTAEGDGDPAAAYVRTGSLDAEERTALFSERCGDYRATVTRCGAGEEAIREAVTAACERHGAETLAVAPGLPAAWLPEGLTVRRDDPPLGVGDLDACDGAITAAAGAIAVTGTIVLDAGPDQGRRALTLIPDLHVCVVRASQITEGVPEGIAALGAAVREHGAPVTLISGPSATSDIELQRVEGVHGPRRLEVIVAG